MNIANQMDRKEKIMNWGIVSASRISNKYVEALKEEGCQIYAVAARDIERANNFKRKHNIKIAYGSYEELFNDKNVDIVYISNLNHEHYETVIKAIEAKKHVICEKPLSISHQQAVNMAKAATINNVFLMEAMWTRCLPIYKEIHNLINSGEIGEIMQVRADFSFMAEKKDGARFLNKDMGGGALYDIGIYSIMFILDFLGTDLKNVTASGFIGKSGVDEESIVTINYGNGKMASMYNSFISNRPRLGEIIGTEGMITISDFNSAVSAKVSWFKKSESSVLQSERKDNMFVYEVREVVKSITEGKTQSERIPLEHSIVSAYIIEKAIKEICIQNGKNLN